MFSALKRLTSGRSDGSNGISQGPRNNSGNQPMSAALQRKFAKGCQYNMKIILKGDRNTGKTCLFRRLQGLPFVDEYSPTEEIQVGHIQWSYKITDDVVKVEVWDVVDLAKKRKSLPNKLKIDNSHKDFDGANKGASVDDVQEIGLDATFLDVYKNTNGVIMVYDITKNWTWDYVKREIEKCPSHIPILILGNHRDMGHHSRAVAADTVRYFIESLEREPGAGEIRFEESSMRNAFGLKFVHKFFCLPFLQLQRQTLYEKLETNKQEILLTIQELDFYAESDEANYDMFIDGLSQKRRQVADAQSPQQKLSVEDAKALAEEKILKTEKDKEKAAAAVARLQIQSDPAKNQPVKSSPTPSTKSEQSQKSQQSQVSNTNNGGNNFLPPVKKNMQTKNAGGVDDFVPEEADQIDKSFFDDTTSAPSNKQTNGNNPFESSDEEEQVANVNPLVASVIDDVVPEEFQPKRFAAAITTTTENISSSEEQEENSIPEDNSVTSPKMGFNMFLQSDNVAADFVEDVDLDDDNSGTKEKKKHKKHKKHKKVHKKDSHPMDLEEFLNGPTDSTKIPQDIDTSAYEAI